MTLKRALALLVFAVALGTVIVVAAQFGQGCATLSGRTAHNLKPDPAAHCERFGFWQRFF